MKMTTRFEKPFYCPVLHRTCADLLEMASTKLLLHHNSLPGSWQCNRMFFVSVGLIYAGVFEDQGYLSSSQNTSSCTDSALWLCLTSSPHWILLLSRPCSLMSTLYLSPSTVLRSSVELSFQQNLLPVLAIHESLQFLAKSGLILWNLRQAGLLQRHSFRMLASWQW